MTVKFKILHKQPKIFLRTCMCQHNFCFIFCSFLSENAPFRILEKLNLKNSNIHSIQYKPTDSHSYLQYSISHPKHTFNSIPFAQFLRLRRHCIDDNNVFNKCFELRSFLHYPAAVVDRAMHKSLLFIVLLHSLPRHVPSEKTIFKPLTGIEPHIFG